MFIGFMWRSRVPCASRVLQNPAWKPNLELSPVKMLDMSILYVITGTAGIQGLQCKPDTFYKLWKEMLGMVASPRAFPQPWEHPANTVGTFKTRKYYRKPFSMAVLLLCQQDRRNCGWEGSVGLREVAVGPFGGHSGRWGDTSSVREGETRALPWFSRQMTSWKVPRVPLLGRATALIAIPKQGCAAGVTPSIRGTSGTRTQRCCFSALSDPRPLLSQPFCFLA